MQFWKMLKSKLGSSMITNPAVMIGAIIGLIVTFLIAAQLLPQAQTAGDTINATGISLGGLFASSGVLWIIILAAIFLGALAMFGFGKRGGR